MLGFTVSKYDSVMKPDLEKLRKLFSQKLDIKECSANDPDRNRNPGHLLKSAGVPPEEVCQFD